MARLQYQHQWPSEFGRWRDYRRYSPKITRQMVPQVVKQMRNHGFVGPNAQYSNPSVSAMAQFVSGHQSSETPLIAQHLRTSRP